MARRFNGSSDYVQLDGVRGNDLLGVMACCWVKPTLTAAGKVIARWDTGVTEQFLLAVDVDGTVIAATLDTGFSGHVATSTTKLSADTWAHIGLIQANGANTLQAYVNGLPDGAPTSSGNLNVSGVESQPVFLGKSATGTFYPGVMAEAVVQLVNTNLAPFAQYEAVMLATASGAAYGVASAIISSSFLMCYLPLLGDDPELDLGGTTGAQTIHGTTVVDHAPTRTIILGVQ